MGYDSFGPGQIGEWPTHDDEGFVVTATMPDIPGYRLHRLLGRGGMGAVYLADQEVLARRVALKVTLPHLNDVDPSFSARFVREIQATANVVHPNVVVVYDAGEHNGLNYMAMEWIAGGTLKQMIANGRATPEVIRRVLVDVVSGLSAAHSAGYVHRDIKPDNILLRENGAAVVTDFGIVKALNASLRLTQTLGTIGSPHYMSPEQLRGEPLDHRCDYYSLGVVLFEMLEGRVPFDGDNHFAIQYQHLTTPPPDLSPGNGHFAELVSALLAKDRSDRPTDSAELMARLAPITSVRRTKGPTKPESKATPKSRKNDGRAPESRRQPPKVASATKSQVATQSATPQKESVLPPRLPTERRNYRSWLTGTFAILIAGLTVWALSNLTGDPPTRSPLPRTGDLKLESNPAEAEVWIGDRLIGKTPTTVSDLPSGTLTLEFRKEGHGTVVRSVDVLSGGQAVVFATLFRESVRSPASNQASTVPAASDQLEYAELVLTSEPAGASVLIDGRHFGLTPVTSEIGLGTRSIELRLQDHVSQQFGAQVGAGGLTRHVQLVKTRITVPSGTIRDCGSCQEMKVFAGELREDLGQRLAEPIEVAPFAVGVAEVSIADFSKFVASTEFLTAAESRQDGGATYGVCYELIGLQAVRSADANWRHPASAGGSQHPVSCLARDDAEAYLEWLSADSHYSYRLLTEHEWLFLAQTVAAAATDCRHSNISDPSREDGAECVMINGTVPVDSMRADQNGLFHFFGNASEHLSGCWKANAMATGAGDCSFGLLRGGSWLSTENDLFRGLRDRAESNRAVLSGGFRVARSWSGRNSTNHNSDP